MAYLITASVLWAFSFGLIKGQLAGLDPVAVACLRLVLAAAAFAPALGRASLDRRSIGAAAALGALQFGLMYILYLAAFAWLPAWMVALFTVFTPLYVILMADLRSRRLAWRHLAAALLAVAGAAVVTARGLPTGADWRGVLLLQGANLCFAAGQLLFPGLRRRSGAPEAALLAWMYLGAVGLVAVVLSLRGGRPWADWDSGALVTVTYLGLVPTAIGFYLWNKGAARVRPEVLGAANNLKVPLAVLVSWAVFGETADYWRSLGGLAVILAGLFLVGFAGRRRSPASV